MTNPTNWPNPERPGYPMLPERDGWHALRGKNSRGVKAAYWLADRKAYAPSDIKEERAYADSHSVIGDCYNYVGPNFTPTQIAELLAGERERCAKLLEDAYEKSGKDFEYLGCLSCADEIRDLGGAP